MISPELRARIRRLFYAEHWKMGTIAAELGVHRDTVALAVEPERFTNIVFRPKAALLDSYKDFVRATLEQHPRLRSTRLLQMIQGRRYTGTVWPLRRFVRSVRPGGTREAFFRLSMLPGEQGQVDWASFGSITIGTTRQPLSCFVMVLSWSRAIFARFVLDQTLESFLRCHVAAFAAFEGVPLGHVVINRFRPRCSLATRSFPMRTSYRVNVTTGVSERYGAVLFPRKSLPPGTGASTPSRRGGAQSGCACGPRSGPEQRCPRSLTWVPA